MLRPETPAAWPRCKTGSNVRVKGRGSILQSGVKSLDLDLSEQVESRQVVFRFYPVYLIKSLTLFKFNPLS